MSEDNRKPYDVGGGPVLPTVWRGKGGQAVRSQTPVVHPDEMAPEERALLTETYDTCGTCKYFELAQGQAQIKSQKLLQRLVREENWQVKHLCSPVNELGICGAHDSGRGGDQTLTGTMHRACDQYRPDRGKVSAARRGEY
jgi:hypothetical protein